MEESLGRCAEFFRDRDLTAEIILADDGSTDATADVFHRAKLAHGHLGLAFKVLRLPHRGKGAAVRAGVEAAKGDPIVFLDADLTIPVEIIDVFIAALDTGADIAIASRYVAGSVVDRPWWRRVMGDVFRAVVHLLVPTDIRDTQCGGKMYTAEAAKDLFAKQRLNGFAFDAEVLFLARRAGYTVREIPFALRQHGETRIDFLADTPKMLRDLFVIRLNDMRGLYGT
ncbi:MAG TPA: glycosyltransferase [Verrucomicrobiae bacterium]|nr:glycosyltransferase [Verrucomicrobiae bacterium]